MDRQPGLLWPWVCILLFLFLLAAISPTGWAPEPLPEGGGAKARAARPIERAKTAENPARHPRPAANTAQPADDVPGLPRQISYRVEPRRTASSIPVAASPGQDLESSSAENAVTTVSDEGPILPAAEAQSAPRVASAWRPGAVVDPGPTLALEYDAIEIAAVPAPPARPELDDVPQEPELGDLTANEAAGRWPMPAELLTRLELLAASPAAADWVDDVVAQLRKLTSGTLRPDEEHGVLAGLRRSAEEGDRLAAGCDDAELQGTWRRTRFALTRRLKVWQAIGGFEGPLAAGHHRSPDRLKQALSAVELATADTSAQGWREFLMLPGLRDLVARRGSPTAGDQELVQRVLTRMERPDLSDSQRRFLASGPMAALDEALLPWAAGPVDPRRLLSSLEAYEADGSLGEAHFIAAAQQSLALSPRLEDQELARRLDEQYRICNIRVAVTQGLLNRMLPQQPRTNEPVRTMILGVPVRGRSETETQLNVRAMPDGQRLRLELTTTGDVESSTRSTSGPVELFNQGTARFEARKTIELGPEGIRLHPAKVDVESQNRLSGIRTEFDSIPIVGSLVREYARKEHDEKRSAARRESERQIAQKAGQQVDAAVAAEADKATAKLDSAVLTPLRRMSLEPTWILSESTDRRVVVRARLAGDAQLAAHTPRPQAPSDSLASVQVHQSAVNNVFERLGLDGQAYLAPDLFEHIGHVLNAPPEALPQDVPGGMRFTFAKQDAMRATCADGRIELCLRLDKLEMDRRQWRELVVRVFYKPQRVGPTFELVRDGTIQLSAKRLSPQSQIVVRGLFSRIFTRDGRWTLLDGQWETNPALTNTEITQFTIHDGWISAALGPRRTVETAKVKSKAKAR